MRTTLIYDENDENIIENLLDYQKNNKKNGEKLEQILIIFDDFITNEELNQRRGIFTKLWSMERNFGISLLISSQEYMQILAPLRKMSDNFIIYTIIHKRKNK